jgi:hypothetical protein
MFSSALCIQTLKNPFEKFAAGSAAQQVQLKRGTLQQVMSHTDIQHVLRMSGTNWFGHRTEVKFLRHVPACASTALTWPFMHARILASSSSPDAPQRDDTKRKNPFSNHPIIGGACCLADAAVAGTYERSRQQQQSGDPTKRLK